MQLSMVIFIKTSCIYYGHFMLWFMENVTFYASTLMFLVCEICLVLSLDIYLSFYMTYSFYFGGQGCWGDEDLDSPHNLILLY